MIFFTIADGAQRRMQHGRQGRERVEIFFRFARRIAMHGEHFGRNSAPAKRDGRPIAGGAGRIAVERFGKQFDGQRSA